MRSSIAPGLGGSFGLVLAFGAAQAMYGAALPQLETRFAMGSGAGGALVLIAVAATGVAIALRDRARARSTRTEGLAPRWVGGRRLKPPRPD